MDLRKQYGEAFEKRHGIRLGFMSFYVKAVVEALKRYPEVDVYKRQGLYCGQVSGTPCNPEPPSVV